MVQPLRWICRRRAGGNHVAVGTIPEETHDKRPGTAPGLFTLRCDLQELSAIQRIDPLGPEDVDAVYAGQFPGSVASCIHLYDPSSPTERD